MKRNTLLLCAFIFPTQMTIGQENPNESPSLVEQVKLGWEHIRNIEQKSGELQANYHYTLKSSRNEDYNLVYSIKANGVARKIESTDSAICVNDRYAFSLKRKNASDAWRLDEHYLIEADPRPLGLAMLLILSNFDIITRPTTEFDPQISYYSAINSGRLALADAGIDQNGHRKVSYVLTFQHPAAVTPLPLDVQQALDRSPPAKREEALTNLKKMRKMSGTMLLDSTRSWRPVRVEGRAEQFPFLETTTTLMYGKELLCQAVKYENKSAQSHMNISLEYTPVMSRTDPADFTLSAYGLPEPVGVEWERPTPWYLYFAAVTALFVTATALFAWLSRRRAAAPNPA